MCYMHYILEDQHLFLCWSPKNKLVPTPLDSPTFPIFKVSKSLSVGCKQLATRCDKKGAQIVNNPTNFMLRRINHVLIMNKQIISVGSINIISLSSSPRFTFLHKHDILKLYTLTYIYSCFLIFYFDRRLPLFSSTTGFKCDDVPCVLHCVSSHVLFIQLYWEM